MRKLSFGGDLAFFGADCYNLAGMTGKIEMMPRELFVSGRETEVVSEFVLQWTTSVLGKYDSILIVGGRYESLAGKLKDFLCTPVRLLHLTGNRSPAPRDQSVSNGGNGIERIDDIGPVAVDAIWWLVDDLFDLRGALAVVAKNRPSIGCLWPGDAATEIAASATDLNYDAHVAWLPQGELTGVYLILLPRERKNRFKPRARDFRPISWCEFEDFDRGTLSRLNRNSKDHGRGPKGPLVAISFYRAPHLVDFIRKGLLRIAPELKELECQVALYNDSPDDRSLASTLQDAKAELTQYLDCTLETNAENLGFVKTMNVAMARARSEGRDILMLNSDAVLGPGSLEEMVQVADADPMIGFVCPRSNNATIATAGEAAAVAYDAMIDQRDIERRICASLRFLPRYQFVPTAVGFCLLIKNSMLVEFGDFSVAYGMGYNEENDFVLRAGRCGFRAALANWAYALHLGEQSFALQSEGRASREGENRRLLDRRYPEYDSLIKSYFGSGRFRLESFLTILRRTRPAIAIDCTALSVAHNGTIFLITNLVKEISRRCGADIDITLIGNANAFGYHGLDSVNGITLREPWPEEQFDVALRIGQPFSESCVVEMCRIAPVNVFFMLDTIAIDCCQLNTPSLELLWDYVGASADGIVFNSAFTRDQFNRRFPTVSQTNLRKVSYHSVDPADYKQACLPIEIKRGYVLIIGNHYPHKNVWPTYHALVVGAPNHNYVVLAGKAGETLSDREDRTYESGALSSELIASLYANSSIVVFPSFYEGFGFPILNSLAYHRPVLVRHNSLNVELSKLIDSPNLHMYADNSQLLKLMLEPPEWVPESTKLTHNWQDSAREVIDICLECLNRSCLEKVFQRTGNLRNLLLDIQVQEVGTGVLRQTISDLISRVKRLWLK